MLESKALKIAKKAHEGQVDKAGQPYIKHPLAVAAAVDTPEEKVVALLHDVVEDSNFSLEDLSAAGFPTDVLVAVEAITKTPGLDYWAYLKKVKENSLARKVKIADRRHNMDLPRLPIVSHKDRQRVIKYQKALEYLL